MPLSRPSSTLVVSSDCAIAAAQARGDQTSVDAGAEEIDQRVEIVHAGRGHGSRRRLLRVGPPVIAAGHEVAGRRGLRALAMGREPEAAIVDSPSSARSSPGESAGDRGRTVTRDPGARHRIERPFGAFERRRVNGFSMKTCLPAAAVRSTCGPCWLCGVAKTTASTAGSGEDPPEIVGISDAVLGAKRLGGGAGAAVAGGEDETAVLLSWIALTRVRPQRPSPTIAARIICAPPRACRARAAP